MMNVLLMASPDGEAGGLTAFLPLLVVIVIFYFFMIRPQMKRQKEVRNFRANLKKGDKVLTLGGIYGKIIEIQENVAILEIADGVKVKVEKSGIVSDNTDISQPK